MKDQMGRRVKIPENPIRIISLVPSQTELLYDLGLGDKVVGITKFCLHPKEWKKTKTIVGGTKQVHFERIADLNPDLIIGNKEENEKGFIEQLSDNFPVWMSDINTLDDALDMIEAIGEITTTSAQAESLVVDILTAFSELKKPKAVKTTAYLIWNNPIMVAGKATFIDDMMSKVGYVNAIEIDRYPEVSLERLKELEPDIVLLSSEPFPFKKKHLAEFKSALPNAEVQIVDGEMFSWYGSRLLKAPAYFKRLKD